MAYRITAEDRMLVDEFRHKPLGPYSPALLRVLHAMRGGPMAGKYVLLCTKPFREWQLARHPGHRGKPMQVLEGQVFDSREAAEWTVFRLRWKELTGEELN